MFLVSRFTCRALMAASAFCWSCEPGLMHSCDEHAGRILYGAHEDDQTPSVYFSGLLKISGCCLCSHRFLVQLIGWIAVPYNQVSRSHLYRSSRLSRPQYPSCSRTYSNISGRAGLILAPFHHRPLSLRRFTKVTTRDVFCT